MRRDSPHWHVNIQAVASVPEVLLTSMTSLEQASDTKPMFHLGLKAAAEFARSAWGPGWRGGSLGILSATGLAATWGLHPQCPHQPWLDSSRGWTQGHCQLEGVAAPVQPTPLMVPKPPSQFAHGNSVSFFEGNERHKCSLGSTMF